MSFPAPPSKRRSLRREEQKKLRRQQAQDGSERQSKRKARTKRSKSGSHPSPDPTNAPPAVRTLKESRAQRQLERERVAREEDRAREKARKREKDEAVRRRQAELDREIDELRRALLRSDHERRVQDLEAREDSKQQLVDRIVTGITPAKPFPFRPASAAQAGLSMSKAAEPSHTGAVPADRQALMSKIEHELAFLRQRASTMQLPVATAPHSGPLAYSHAGLTSFTAPHPGPNIAHLSGANPSWTVPGGVHSQSMAQSMPAEYLLQMRRREVIAGLSRP